MTKWRRRIFTLLFGVMVAIAIVISQNSLLASSVGKDTLRMITSPDYPPFEYYDQGAERKIVGFDIDIANYIAKELGFKLEVMESDFSGLIPALQANRADFAMASMNPTPERLRNLDFSIVYYQGKDTIIAPVGSNITKLEDLAGKRVGVQLGTTQEQSVKEIGVKLPSMEIKLLNKAPDMIQEIKSGRIDAVILGDTVAQGFTQSNPELEFHPLSSNKPDGGSAIAFSKGSSLVAPFNKVLQKMLDGGEVERLKTKWFALKSPDAATSKPAAKGLNLDLRRIIPDIPFILQGIPVSLLFTLLSLFFGLIWGTLLTVCKITGIKPLILFANAYTSVFRGTPMLLQLALVYYATPQLTGYDISALQAGVLTFTLNSGAYLSETIRGGIQAVDKGQTEAALSMGVPYYLMMSDIIMPQALKNILPALVNEAIGLLKDSALVSTLGMVEILRSAQIVGANKYIYFEPLLFAGLIYYVLVMALTRSASTLEMRLRRSE
ncbi:MAG: ABC transporter substrate-binding protein/permease [Cyanomargarita calcarea GSE-NOS-MK-12-04C]|jgi:polar amino acid transport system substrate-binding protein|uniref:ABC transporter substrate-binding protein/permease n=1 Tax=Cyanomargarita calcarea GSE-NOS-MK-12-04C TaxID=2839659 RepID=A0A951QIT7_9CYAN|nr:ABC transporter substrate-binding protein/permease [Cyanomargarita calcarea GSE-NOS-MK-12-04C]